MTPNRKMGKPRWLYHGSPKRVPFFEPRPGRGLGLNKDDRRRAVFATDNKFMACIFALGPVPSKNKCRWGFDADIKGKTRIYIYKGRLNPSGRGYVYKLPSKTFRKSYGHQWTSTKSVIPIGCETVKKSDFKNKIRYEFRK
ncbi:MAG: hypothetical protein HYT39_01320 [Candidatus Sungbacteria bacterium]|nr:hypothetical protein [Candidatus Sungbacteria bacterium]